MAQQVEGRRDIVQDPLRQQAQQPQAERSVQTTGIRGPSMPSMAGLGQQQSELDAAMGGLNDVLGKMFDEQKDTWITEGKTAYMSGVTEAELMKNGNRYTQMGFLQLKARNDVNQFYLQEQSDLASASSTMEPAEYQKYLSEKRKTFLDGIQDPYAKKVAVAAFEQVNPDLAQKQFVQNNSYNLDQRDTEVQRYLDTGTIASPTAGKVIPGETSLKISPTPVEPVMSLVGNDRDLGIKTLIGEAGNQGEFGMAAVAHVIRNRATDSRYPNSITGVVTQKSQFSVWNKGKEGRAGELSALGPGNPLYDKAAKVFDAVMSGRHVDPTGGALNYHSPAGMTAYAAQGVKVSQATLNRTRAAEADGNSIRIGGHVFYNKTDGAGRTVREPIEPVAQGDYVDPMVSTDERDNPFPGKAKDDLLPSTAGTTGASIIDQQNQQAAQNEGVAGVKEAGAPNETLDFIRNYKGLPKDRMAKNVAKSMARQLDAGNDTLFNDAGGTSILYELGADASDIDAVQKAKARYDAAQDKKYDEDDLKFEDDILRMADDPGADPEKIRGLVTDRVKTGEYTDEQGKTLARQAAATIRARENQATATADAEAKKQKEARDSVFANPDFLQEIGGLYQQIKAGTVSFETAADNVKLIADGYGAKDTDVEKMMGEIQRIDQARKDELRNKAEAAIASTATSTANKQEAQQAIGRGFGISNLSGEVKVTDGAGQTVKMSTKEYAIQQIKQEAIIKHTTMQQTDSAIGKTPVPDKAAIAIEVFTKLQQHGVVDTETKAQMTAAMAGNIIDPKTKEVNKSAQEAYDLYTTLRRNPQINEGYLAEMVGDPYTRTLLETAYTLDGGNLTGPEALVRAKELLSQKDFDPNQKIARDAVFNAQSQVMGKSLVEEATNPGFWSYFGARFDSGEINRAVQIGAPMIQQQLQSAADSYYLQFPGIQPEAALNLAKADVKKNMKVIAGNVIVTPDKLNEKMGLKNPESVNDAVKGFVAEYGKDLFFQGDATKHLNALTAESINPTPGDRSWGKNTSLPVNVRWMPNIGPNGSFAITRIKDSKTNEPDTATQVFIQAEKIGAWYTKSQATPSALRSIYDSARHGLATKQQVHNAGEAGNAIGAMFKPN
ncbi:cell wall hydrolase SleB-like protein [Rhizobium phage RHEph15]|nr:cell wall hydrolase SleB-like protein [Rhizobium phage RHEph15]QXV74994.1 cell wall hydrolase SleB-like protein [Rhizobium phage RHEph27]